MATKEAVFNVKVNTGNSVKEVQDLDKSLDNLNKATDETTKSTRDVNATFEQVYGELQPLTTRLGEAEDRLYELALAGEQASEEYQNLLEVVTNYRKTQIAVDQAVDASAQTMGQKLVANVQFGASAFQGFQSATALAGVESEKLVQTMVKLQAIQGVVGSIQALNQGLRESTIGMKLASIATGAYNAVVGTSTGLMKLFRIALASTGIGLLVIGIASLIGNFDKLFAFMQPVIDAFKRFGDWIGITSFEEDELEKARKKRHEAQVKRAKKEREILQQAIEDLKDYAKELEEQNRLENRYYNSRIKNLETQRKLAKGNADEEAKIDKQITDEKIKELERQKEAFIEEQKAILKINEAAIKSNNKSQSDANKGLIKLSKDFNKVKLRVEENYFKLQDQLRRNDFQALVELDQEIASIQADATVRENDELKKRQDNYKKFIEERNKIEQQRLFNIKALENEFLNELEELDEEHYQMTLTAQEKEETAVNDKYFRLIETAKKYGMDTTDLETKQQTELAVIREKFADQELKNTEERNKKLADLRENFDKLWRDQFDQSIKDLRDANAEQLKVLQEANDEGLISEGEFYLAKLKLANDLADAEKEIELEKNEFIKQQQIKAREEQLEGITKVLEGAQKGLDGLNQINALANEIDQARLNSIQNKRDENLENLDANLQAQLNNENLTAEQKAQIEESFAQQKFAIQQKAFEEEEKIKKAQFNRDKALKLAQVSIDTASAIVKAIAQFGPPPSPLGIAGIASAGVIGLTQALAILNQQYQGGSAPSPPQIGGASAGSLAGAGASQFTANTEAEQTDLTTLGQDVPVSQVVVLESDITGTQSKVAVQEAKSSF